MQGMPEERDRQVPAAGDCYLGFDFGLRRIGIASGNSTTRSAMPLTTVSNHNGTLDWQSIDAVVAEWQPTALVVGRPLQLDGSTQPMTREADGFIRRLQKRYQLPVHPADERETSKMAEQVKKNNRRNGQSGKTSKPDIDKIAAALILQRWLEALPPQ